MAMITYYLVCKKVVRHMMGSARMHAAGSAGWVDAALLVVLHVIGVGGHDELLPRGYL